MSPSKFSRRSWKLSTPWKSTRCRRRKTTFSSAPTSPSERHRRRSCRQRWGTLSKRETSLSAASRKLSTGKKVSRNFGGNFNLVEKSWTRWSGSSSSDLECRRTRQKGWLDYSISKLCTQLSSRFFNWVSSTNSLDKWRYGHCQWAKRWSIGWLFSIFSLVSVGRSAFHFHANWLLTAAYPIWRRS